MFQFAGYLSCRPCIHLQMTAHVCCRVPPFGHLRFFASLQLHGAFRSLARPSSVSSGQAFAVRPSLLNQWFSCVSRCSFSRTVFYCFLSLSYNLRFRPFLLCLFFMLFSFQRSIPLSDPSIPQNQTRIPLELRLPFLHSFSLERR